MSERGPCARCATRISERWQLYRTSHACVLARSKDSSFCKRAKRFRVYKKHSGEAKSRLQRGCKMLALFALVPLAWEVTGASAPKYKYRPVSTVIATGTGRYTHRTASSPLKHASSLSRARTVSTVSPRALSTLSSGYTASAMRKVQRTHQLLPPVARVPVAPISVSVAPTRVSTTVVQGAWCLGSWMDGLHSLT